MPSWISILLAWIKPLSHCTLVPENCQKNCRSAFCVNAKHLIPGWGPNNIAGSVPERALCEQKPDQCCKGCVVVMTHCIVRLIYRLFEGRSRSHDEKCVNWNEAAIRELLIIRLKLKSFTPVSENGARRIIHVTWNVTWFTGCVWTHAHTDSGKSLAVWMNQNQTIPGQITGHIFRVFSGMAVWKRL